MQWTKELPEHDKYYWYRVGMVEDGETHYTEPEPCSTLDGRLWYIGNNADHDVPTNDGYKRAAWYEWAGPIEWPEEKAPSRGVGLVRERLTKARKKRGLSEEGLAEKANLVVANIYQFESGERRPCRESLVLMASALGVSADWLEGREPPENAGPPVRRSNG